jgi:predicted aldo/keto reductase-like oxidoreductase|tara:strand:- start:90 stop:347 length:258 start_codon:yes stop_codon:yes gene_type:complete
MKISEQKQEIEILNKLNSQRIMTEISKHIAAGVPYIDAVIDYADRNQLEVEVIGEIIRRSPVLKAEIYKEAEELNMVERLVRLPV